MIDTIRPDGITFTRKVSEEEALLLIQDFQRRFDDSDLLSRKDFQRAALAEKYFEDKNFISVENFEEIPGGSFIVIIECDINQDNIIPSHIVTARVLWNDTLHNILVIQEYFPNKLYPIQYDGLSENKLFLKYIIPEPNKDRLLDQ